MVAQIGGFLARQGDGHPGAIALWRGLDKLAFFTDSYTLFHPAPPCRTIATVFGAGNSQPKGGERLAAPRRGVSFGGSKHSSPVAFELGTEAMHEARTPKRARGEAPGQLFSNWASTTRTKRPPRPHRMRATVIRRIATDGSSTPSRPL